MKKFRQWWTNTFTLHRWALNPSQMYSITFLLAAAIAQVELGSTPGGILADQLDRQTILSLAVANVIGGGIALFGLHLRDLESALWVELCGYLLLVFVVGIYVTLLIIHQPNANASYGFALSEAFVFSALHRGVQIALYKRARRKRLQLAREANRLQRTLESILPSAPVKGEEGP